MRNKEEVLKTIQMENYIWIVYLNWAFFFGKRLRSKILFIW